MKAPRISCAAPALAVFMAAGATAGAESAAVTHLSHRAFYEVSIGRVAPGADVIDAQGGMVAEWARGCEGWTSTQRLAMSMSQSSGARVDSTVALSSFESFDGTRYRFDGKTTLGGGTVEEVRGTAERPGRGEPGMARYEVPRGERLALPADTLFPFEHTIDVIEAAEAGRNQTFAHYFDGSQPEISPMGASTLVLGEAHPAEEGADDALDPGLRARWWPVRLAWFANGDKAEQPEFEMTQILQDNGVVRRFEFDYGEFAIVAALVRIEALDEPDCK